MVLFSLLAQAGDVESNPGPSSRTRQTTLSVGTTRKDSPEPSRDNRHPPAEPSNADIMTAITSLSSKLGDLSSSFSSLAGKVNQLSQDSEKIQDHLQSLVCENKSLRKANEEMESRLEALALKVDDLECRGRRNNLIFHGIPRGAPRRGESKDCESTLKETLSSHLGIRPEDLKLDRVHRLGGFSPTKSKPPPMIARFSFYKERQQVLKESRKFKGSSVHVQEDFSPRVREIRRKLAPRVARYRDEGKRATLVFDHIIVDGRKEFLEDGTRSYSDVLASPPVAHHSPPPPSTGSAGSPHRR